MQLETAPPEIFPHIRIVMGIVLGLAITRLLTGTARFVQHPRRQQAYWLHLAWVLYMLTALTHFWWWEFWLYGITLWTYEFYVFLIAYTVLLYLICALLYPDDINEYSGWEAYFISRRQWFFGLLAASFVFDLVDTLLKGREHFAWFGVEYLVRTPVLVALCIAAMFIANRIFQAAFVIAALVYQIIWILRLFHTLD
jgi:hypothetical protein